MASHQWFGYNSDSRRNENQGRTLPGIKSATKPNNLLCPVRPERDAGGNGGNHGNNGNHHGGGHGAQGAGGNHNNRPPKVRGQEYTVTVKEYINGNEGTPFFVKLQFEDKSTERIPFSKLKMNPNNRKFIMEEYPIGSQFVMKYESTTKVKEKE